MSHLVSLPFGDVEATYLTVKNSVVTAPQVFNLPNSGDILELSTGVVILYPSACLSTLTLNFPDAQDGQNITLISHRPVTSLTINNATFENGSPGSLSSHTPMKYFYSSFTSSWWNS
jgi:hypothetical protein